jgi:predicted FMN-binding regulatory protein PaiB
MERFHGHISRQNPQSITFDGKQTGVIVFHGPHGRKSVATLVLHESSEARCRPGIKK